MEKSRDTKRPKFNARKGQVDYTNVRLAPVMNCIVKYRDKILVVQRSKKLGFFPGCWSGVSGFLDDKRSFKQKVKDEIQEELGIPGKMVKNIRLCEIFHQEAPKYKKTWIVHPVLVEVKTDRVKLDWEAKNYRWIRLADTKKLKLLPGFDRVLEKVSPWVK